MYDELREITVGFSKRTGKKIPLLQYCGAGAKRKIENGQPVLSHVIASIFAE